MFGIPVFTNELHFSACGYADCFKTLLSPLERLEVHLYQQDIPMLPMCSQGIPGTRPVYVSVGLYFLLCCTLSQHESCSERGLTSGVRLASLVIDMLPRL